MAITPTPTIDYTSIDFDAIRARLFNLIAQVFPQWTDTDVANFGNLLVELFAHTGDGLGFYLENRARESRWSQARLRSTVVAMVKLIAYVPTGASAATGEVTLTLAAPATGAVIFPAGTLVRTQNVVDPVIFQLTEEAVIPALANPPTITVPIENSRSYTTTFTATGLANQEIRLQNTPYLDDSAEIEATNGVYSQVTSFLVSGPTDLHFTVVVDNNDRAAIRFGNGSSGVIPTGTINVNYKTGGGANGNVEEDTIKRIDGNFTDEFATAVRVTVTNAAPTSGGGPRQSRAQIQEAAPASLAATTRTVARTDYEAHARRVSGVARSLMLTSNQLAAIAENRGRLYIVPEGGGVASTALKEAVYTMVTVTYPCTLTFDLEVLTAEYLTIDVTVALYVRPGVNKAALATSIRNALVSFFALTTGTGDDLADNPNVNFGFYASLDSTGSFDGAISYSDIYNVVRDVPGVRKIRDGLNGMQLNGAAKDVPVETYEFPVLGVVTLIDAETGTLLGT